MPFYFTPRGESDQGTCPTVTNYLYHRSEGNLLQLFGHKFGLVKTSRGFINVALHDLTHKYNFNMIFKWSQEYCTSNFKDHKFFFNDATEFCFSLVSRKDWICLSLTRTIHHNVLLFLAKINHCLILIHCKHFREFATGVEAWSELDLGLITSFRSTAKSMTNNQTFLQILCERSFRLNSNQG